MTTVGEARDIARDWATRDVASMPGFRGALTHGSTNWLADGEDLEPASDLDLLVVLDAPPEAKPGKRRAGDVLLDVGYLAADALDPIERVLGRYQLAGSVATARILADPTGWLTDIQTRVARDYPQHRWVRARLADAVANIERYLGGDDPAAPLPARATAWLFGTGVTTHVLLVAGLRNPTVRSRYLAVRDLLTAHDRLEVHEALLDLLGCATFEPARVVDHLTSLTIAFDAATSVVRSPLPFAADLSVAARPVAIDGSLNLIARGFHREAVFWIAVTYARCLTVFHLDAPALTPRHEPGFRTLLADLGIHADADFPARLARTLAFLPALSTVAEEIVAANPAIVDD